MKTDIYTTIDNVLSLQSYTPSMTVNKTMSELVSSIVSTREQPDIASETIARVQQICSMTESELETYWAKRIIQSSDPHATLQEFPYINNYKELVEREVRELSASGLGLDDMHSALIIGSGPLPLSAYELRHQTGARVDHVDSSLDAIELCRQLCSALQESSEFYIGDGETVALHRTYDFILIAGLAGSTLQDKQRILNNVLPHLAVGGRVILRGAMGSRVLLYPGFDPRKIRGVTLLSEYHPSDHVINSVYVYGAPHEA